MMLAGKDAAIVPCTAGTSQMPDGKPSGLAANEKIWIDDDEIEKRRKRDVRPSTFPERFPYIVRIVRSGNW